jgi:hypothetical protein
MRAKPVRAKPKSARQRTVSPGGEEPADHPIGAFFGLAAPFL